MGVSYIIWLNIVTSFSVLVTSADLSQRLRKYEIIRINDTRLHKRSFENGAHETIRISSLGRNFSVSVWPARGVLSPSFRTVLVRDGKDDELDYVDPGEVLHGEVKGCARSFARLIRTEHGLLGSFGCDGEDFYMEPALLHDDTAGNEDTLMYRGSDVVPSTNVPIDFPEWTTTGTLEPGFKENLPAATLSRKRREVSEPVENNRCAMKIIADYTFYKRAGSEKLPFTSRYIVNLFDRVNQIFTKTDFGLDSSGRHLINLGFTIKEIIILEKYNESRYHYNSNRTWNATDLLTAFTDREESLDFCLVHLLTARSFPGGALGLAYVGSVPPGAGICPQTVPRAFNTLMSSVAATAGTQLLVTREADIVTAHELGHSWGAPHDKEEEQCLAKDEKGGYYIMHPFAVSGYDPNNVKFSECSKSFMRRVLSYRAEDCFTPQQMAVCGNGVLEIGEQCDEGFIVPGQPGRCCTRECKLFAGAQCSPRNHPCCSPTCVFLTNKHICRHANFLQCTMESNCTGTDGDCPVPKATPDGSLCVDGGECRNGTCLPFCERSEIGKKACICTDAENACKRCCREKDSSQCLPEPRGDVLRDGTFCIQGTCKQAKCVHEVVDVVSHFWGVLEGVDGSNWRQFFKTNIAGIVVTLSLVIWVPISIIVCRWDRERSTPRNRKKANQKVGACLKNCTTSL